MAGATLSISSKNYSSWSLRGWLLCRMAGLDFNTATVNRIVLGKKSKASATKYVPPDPTDDINRTMRGLWPLVELLLPRRRNAATSRKWHIGPFYLPLGERRRIRDDALVHVSVRERIAARDDYRPANLPTKPDYFTSK